MKVARMRIKGETPSETTTHSNRIEILTDSIEIMVTTNNLLHLEDLMFPLLKKQKGSNHRHKPPEKSNETLATLPVKIKPTGLEVSKQDLAPRTHQALDRDKWSSRPERGNKRRCLIWIHPDSTLAVGRNALFAFCLCFS